MDHERLFAISAAGMNVERTRVEVAALNLANATTIQTTDGAAYRPMRVMARPGVSLASFIDQVDHGLEEVALAGVGLPQASVEPTGAAPRIVHDPGHPFADENGDISYPGVNSATEMITLMSAIRAYEANVAAMNVTRTLVLKTLDIGGA